MQATTAEALRTPADVRVGDVQMYIDGTWCDPGGGQRLPIINPATEEQIGTLPDASAEDVDRAVRAAHAAFAEGEGAWVSKTVAERVAILGRVLDVLEARYERIAALESADAGMTIRNATQFHAMAAPGFLRATLAQAPSDVPQGQPLTEVPVLAANFLRREAIGVIAAMPPSNAGYMMSLYKAFAALVMGNSVVLKPSPLCSLTSVEIAKAISEEPEIPKGVFHLVHGDAVAGAALTGHPLVDKISFTGSDATARHIAAAAAPNLTPMTLELGGKGPVIVCDDADLDVAVDGILWGIMWVSGQACIAGSRLLVSEGLKDELVERLKARMATIVVGDTSDHDTDFGPVASQVAVDRIERYLEEAVAGGARIVAGGGRPAHIERGYYIEPTIIDGVTNDMDIAREEVFGPVLAVMTFSDLDEAVRIANDSAYGLAGTVWSQDIPQAMAVAKRLRAGTIWINEHHLLSPTVPFGGYKQSGMGYEFGVAGLEAYTELKHVHLSLSGKHGNPAWGIVLGH